MTDASLNDILVAMARIEAKQDAILSSLARLQEADDVHWKKIAALETEIAVLQQRQGPRVHWITYLIGVVAVLGFIIAIADRLYNQIGATP